MCYYDVQALFPGTSVNLVTVYSLVIKGGMGDLGFRGCRVQELEFREKRQIIYVLGKVGLWLKNRIMNSEMEGSGMVGTEMRVQRMRV